MFSLCTIASFSFVAKDSAIKKESTAKTQKRLDRFTSLVQAGTFELKNQKYNVQSFLMMKEEVTNFEFKVFLLWLKDNNYEEEYHRYYPDTTISNHFPSLGTYLKSPHYRDFPVVGVSHEAAVAYCEWATERNRERILNQNIKFRLPTKEEWIWAAKGGQANAIYGWNNQFVNETNANFRHVNAARITVDLNGNPIILNDVAKIDQPLMPNSKSTFAPNEFGLYNMNGNVAEMISEPNVVMGGSYMDFGHDIQCTSERVMTTKSSFDVGFRCVVEYR